jgi:hypothetical protein
MSRPPISFAELSAAESDIERVCADVRRRIAELDAELAPVLAGLDADEVERSEAARGRRDTAVADLCTALGHIGTALAAARDAGRPSAYTPPAWS